MTKALCSIGIAFMLWAPASAKAGWQIDRSVAIARVVWHHPCVDRLRISWAQTPNPLWRSWADTEGCVIYFNDRKPLHWLDFCHAVLHEAGHLAQFRDPLNHDDSLHSHLAASVMYAVVLLGNDPRCRDRGRPFLERHGLLTHRQH